jgi:hypothetical protein
MERIVLIICMSGGNKGSGRLSSGSLNDTIKGGTLHSQLLSGVAWLKAEMDHVEKYRNEARSKKETEGKACTQKKKS